ncbi:MAG: WYL domain-containing protein [Propionibacteriaceae bacterium]|nr:WYL domain-containing protein [Propionibacteriaceae bacterium]
MSRSIEQVARMLSEIPYIQAHPGVSVKDVAAVFGVSEAEVVDDVRVAIYCGLPGGFPGELIDVDLDVMDDEKSLYLNNPTPLGRPVRLSGAEAASLQVALMAVRAVADEETVAAIDSLTAKIGRHMPQAVDVRLATGDERVRAVLSHAIRAAQQVELTYDGLARGKTTHPVVDPAEIAVRDGAGYLTAYDVSSLAWRTYRLDRIADARPTGEAARCHEGRPGDDSWRKSLAEGHEVQVVVADRAAWIAEYYPVTGVERLPDGATRVTLRIVDPAWLVRLLLTLGPDVMAVAPDTCWTIAQGLARQALDLYDPLA